MSGTGRILGRLELRLWLIISGLSKLGFSPALGISRWFPVMETSTVADPGVESFKHWRESPRTELSEKVAATENYPNYKLLVVRFHRCLWCEPFKATYLLLGRTQMKTPEWTHKQYHAWSFDPRVFLYWTVYIYTFTVFHLNIPHANPFFTGLDLVVKLV